MKAPESQNIYLQPRPQHYAHRGFNANLMDAWLNEEPYVERMEEDDGKDEEEKDENDDDEIEILQNPTPLNPEIYDTPPTV